MKEAIIRDFRWGHNFIQLSFPLAEHSESAWSSRVHIPLQIFFGRIRRVSKLYLSPDYEKPVQSISAGEDVEI